MGYGSQTSSNILADEILEDWSLRFGRERLSVTHVLSNEPADSGWDGERGLISKNLIAKHIPGPLEDCLLFVCGPPPMYNALCGPRDDDELTGLLSEMSYRHDQVYK